jgi:hypothetical protein
MPVFLRTVFVCVFGSLLLAKAVPAAEVTCLQSYSNGACFNALLSGQITKGDFKKVAAIYARNHPYLGHFTLLSIGGDVEEAIKIGRLFRRYLILAEAPTGHGEPAVLLDPSNIQRIACQGANCVCASSCALIWFGAVLREGTVGLHRPHFAGTGFAQLAPAEAETTYRPVLNRLRRYLEEMEAPESAIEAMLGTSSADIQWINDDNLDRATSFSEWLEAACGHIASSKEIQLSAELRVRELNSARNPNLSLSASEKQILPVLSQKAQSRLDCEGLAIAKNRARLPSPQVVP